VTNGLDKKLDCTEPGNLAILDPPGVILLQEIAAPWPLLKRFPAQINKENNFRNGEPLSKNRDLIHN
jgi:hypothetical protein